MQKFWFQGHYNYVVNFNSKLIRGHSGRIVKLAFEKCQVSEEILVSIHIFGW